MDDSPAPVAQKHVKLEGVVTNPGKGDQTLTIESRAWVAWKCPVNESAGWIVPGMGSVNLSPNVCRIQSRVQSSRDVNTWNNAVISHPTGHTARN